MATPRYFQVEPQGETLIFSSLSNIGALAEADVHDECDALIEEVSKHNAKHAIVDLDRLDYFGSVMLQALLAVWNRLKPAGGKFVVCNVSAIGQQVLHTAKLDSIWSVSDSREDAMAAVKSSSPRCAGTRTPIGFYRII